MAASGSCLLDSNIVLRIGRNDDPEYGAIAHALLTLSARQVRLCYTSQTIGEAWNVATRPTSKNGLGLSIEETDRLVGVIERYLDFLPDSPEVHQRWRRLLVESAVRGAQVHDARLAASMYVHGIETLLTINVRDFRRFKGLQIVHPAEM